MTALTKENNFGCYQKRDKNFTCDEMFEILARRVAKCTIDFAKHLRRHGPKKDSLPAIAWMAEKLQTAAFEKDAGKFTFDKWDKLMTQIQLVEIVQKSPRGEQLEKFASIAINRGMYYALNGYQLAAGHLFMHEKTYGPYQDKLAREKCLNTPY